MSNPSVGRVAALAISIAGILALLFIPKVEVPDPPKPAVVSQMECTETVSVTKKMASDGTEETTVKTQKVPCEKDELSFGAKVGLTALRIFLF